MLRYYGTEMAMELGEAARHPYLQLYARPDSPFAFVPFIDLETGKKRYVKFERMEGVEGWIYVDLVDNN